MTTPLIVLSILLLPLIVSIALSTRYPGVDARSGGIVGLAIAFVFFGIGHFAQTAPMAEMLPAWVPFRVPIIFATGVLEWLLAVGLLVPRFRPQIGWACLGVLVAFFPANIYAAVNSIGMGGHQWGPVYLLIRAPLQLVLIAWTYWFAIRPAGGAELTAHEAQRI